MGNSSFFLSFFLSFFHVCLFVCLFVVLLYSLDYKIYLIQFTFSCRHSICGTSCGYVKDRELSAFNDTSLQNALETFEGIANMGSVSSISKHRQRLKDDIETERKRYFEANSLKNPFKDLEYYIVPIVIAAISWLASGVIGRTCSHKVCHVTNDALQRLYQFIIFVMLIVCYRSVIGSYSYLKELANLVLQRQSVEGIASVVLESKKNK